MSVSEEKITFTRNLRELGFNSYSAYLNSAHWKSMKKNYKNQNKRKCVICKSKKNLNLHHKTYENLGKEKFEDLVYLCSSCHSIVHYYVDQDMLKLDLSNLRGHKSVSHYARPSSNQKPGREDSFFDKHSRNNKFETLYPKTTSKSLDL